MLGLRCVLPRELEASGAMNAAELIGDFPLLYHATSPGGWPGIVRHGLLSTSRLLELFEVRGAQRIAIEQCRRPHAVTLTHPVHGRAVLRDQKPMSDAGLARCLENGLAPSDWYRLLNGKAFFWTSRVRLQRHLQARSHRHCRQEVLVVDTARLVEACGRRLRLSPINSGCTWRRAQVRGHATFASIAAYPYAAWLQRRPRWDAVVEVAIDGGIADVTRYVRHVEHLGADGAAPEILWEAQPASVAGRR